MNYRKWELKTAQADAENTLAQAGCGRLLARVLASRGCQTSQQAHALLDEETPLADPYTIKDMDKAVARIRQAVENEEPIVIFGDYDVDGISATAILYEYLTNMGAQVRCKLPTREGGGYGINKDSLQKLAEKGFTLVVTVDNGISAAEEVAYAKTLGIDIVVTDHHLPPETIPDAVAVVDPKRTDDESEFKDLCGAGVAFKLCAALEECDPNELLEECGDLAAIGTIADVMPLVGENRTIVRHGLALLQDTLRPGVAALMEESGLGGKPINAGSVSFSMAPRLNAAGRMDTAAVALKLLLCSDEDQATGIAARLTELNTQRQEAEQQIVAAAQAQLAADPSRTTDRVLVVAGEGWHPGVIGIVASRLQEKYGRPCIVISLQNGEGRGSGRAPRGFNLHSAISACAGQLIRFGGHAAAAGLLVEEDKVESFRGCINAWARKEYPVPAPQSLAVDAQARVEELTLQAVEELSRLAPFGSGNPAPLFLLSGAQVDGIWPLGNEGRHTRLRLRQGSASCFVSLFGVAPSVLPYRVGDAVDAVIEPSIFDGRNGPMLSAFLKAIRPAGLGNQPSVQVAAFTALCGEGVPEGVDVAQFLPSREETVALYKLIRSGSVCAGDLQPVFAALGADKTGKTLVSLTALQELGLVEEQDGRYLPAPTTDKKDLMAAPILRKLQNGAQEVEADG